MLFVADSQVSHERARRIVGNLGESDCDSSDADGMVDALDKHATRRVF